MNIYTYIYIYKEETGEGEGEGEESTNLKIEANVRNSKGEPYSLKLEMCNASTTYI